MSDKNPTPEVKENIEFFPVRPHELPIMGMAALYWNPRIGRTNVALLEPEGVQILERIDSRNAKAEHKFTSGTAADTVKEVDITVPDGEVWYINKATLVVPAECNGNVKIWDKSYLETDAGAATTTDIDFTASGQLGHEIRLLPGDKVKLYLKTTATLTADRTGTLTLYGRKCKKLF